MDKAEIKSFNAKVAGVTFANNDGTSRQNIIRNFAEVGMKVILEPEPNNPHNKNSIKVCLPNKKQIGYLHSSCSNGIARSKKRKKERIFTLLLNELAL